MSQIFTNSQIDIEQLPKSLEVDLKPISSRYLGVLIFNKLLVIVLISLIWFGVFRYVSDLEVRSVLNIVFPGIIIISLVNIIFTIAAFKKRKYAIREKDVIYAKGLLVNSTTVVPFKRIQHIELNQSFLAKKFDVATINIYTAGESGSDLSISGIRTKVAEDINGFLSTKINEFN